jgi:hypothetical protein
MFGGIRHSDRSLERHTLFSQASERPHTAMGGEFGATSCRSINVEVRACAEKQDEHRDFERLSFHRGRRTSYS